MDGWMQGCRGVGGCLCMVCGGLGFVCWRLGEYGVKNGFMSIFEYEKIMFVLIYVCMCICSSFSFLLDAYHFLNIFNPASFCNSN